MENELEASFAGLKSPPRKSSKIESVAKSNIKKGDHKNNQKSKNNDEDHIETSSKWMEKRQISKITFDDSKTTFHIRSTGENDVVMTSTPKEQGTRTKCVESLSKSKNIETEQASETFKCTRCELSFEFIKDLDHHFVTFHEENKKRNNLDQNSTTDVMSTLKDAQSNTKSSDTMITNASLPLIACNNALEARNNKDLIFSIIVYFLVLDY